MPSILEVAEEIPSDINQNKIIIPQIDKLQQISVAVYCGPGVTKSGFENIKNNLYSVAGLKLIEFTSQDIVQKDLSTIDVIIFPGGKAKEQTEALGDVGKEKIRKFVSSGGGYFGICAGLYTSTSGFDWSLGILNAKSKVSKDEWKRGSGFVDIEITEYGKSILGDVNQIFKCRYNNGPLIGPGHDVVLPDFTTIAYFRSEISENGTPEGIMIDTPAAVSAPYGLGRVFVTSVHPENTPGLEYFIPRVLLWLTKKRGITVNTSLSTQDKIEFAAQFAAQKFETVGRKNHFVEVYEILRNEFHISDQNTLIAGILHDTVEDTNTSFEEIEQNFSKEVALLVAEVSHPKDYSGVQVQEYYEKLKHISLPAKMIKLADFLSHLRRLIGIYQRGEEASNPVFVENGRYARDIIAVAETCPPSEAREIVIKLAHELLELHDKSPVWGV